MGGKFLDTHIVNRFNLIFLIFCDSKGTEICRNEQGKWGIIFVGGHKYNFQKALSFLFRNLFDDVFLPL